MKKFLGVSWQTVSKVVGGILIVLTLIAFLIDAGIQSILTKEVEHGQSG